MSKPLGLTCWLALAASTSVAAPSEADWSRCADMDAADARLACYDALVHRAPRPTAAKVSPSPAATPPIVAAPSPPPYDPKKFGLTPAQQHIVEPGPAAITVHIASVTSDQFGHTTISLDNDQTWSVTDNDGRLSTGDVVNIKHGTLGSFILLTLSNHTYHVRRIR